MVFSEPEKIRPVLKESGIKQVWIANYDSPFRTVLSGVRENIEIVKKALADRSIASEIIPINAAPHCPLSLRASNLFVDYVAEEPFDKAVCKLYSHLFGDALENDPELYKKVISITCLKPVRFVDQIEKMYEDGIRTFVEVGPSDGLTLLVKEILGDKPYHALCTNKVKGDDNYHFLSAVAELIKLGRIHDISVLWEGYKAPARPTILSAGHDIERIPEMTAAIAGKELERLKALDLQLSKIDKMVSA
jgi:acyl transferase domain-containing protein